jgi:predicted glycoside hydrolase/deacetylase ChbG (UPF0249 family)
MLRMAIGMAGVAALMAALGAVARADQPIEMVVRGDDMGLTHDVNLGIIKAHTEGILTSASVMPPAPYFDEAVELCRQHPQLAAGIHVTLMATTPVRPVLPPGEIPSLVAPDGFFFRSTEDFSKADPDPRDVEKEVRAQIAKARRMGLHFVYLDWHMTPIRGWKNPQITALFVKIAQEQKLLLTQDLDGKRTGAVYVAAPLERWHAQRMEDGIMVFWNYPGLSEERKAKFIEAIRTLQPGTWWLMVHPGLYMAQQRGTVELLCSAEVKEIVRQRGIHLLSFADLWQQKFGTQPGSP